MKTNHCKAQQCGYGCCPFSQEDEKFFFFPYFLILLKWKKKNKQKDV